MRWAVIAVVAFGCTKARDGTYFIADGHGASIAFDHVEFYFATRLDGSFATRDSGAQTGEVYERLYTDSDRAVPAAPGDPKRATYYVPTAGGTALGNYVMVIAHGPDGKVVGVGESTAFPVAAASELLEVLIPLESPDGVETWGTTPGCAAWNRTHGGWVGVIRADDRDCDDVIAATDCDDYAYCAEADGCNSTRTLCDTPCSVGCPAKPGNTCMASLCLPALVCTNPACTGSSVTDKIACLVTNGSHLEVELATQMPNNRPCEDSFDVMLPTGKCTDPVIEYAEMLPDKYQFSVRANGTSCHFDIDEPSNPGMFTGDHHLLVSIDPGNGTATPRPTFLFGIVGHPKADCSSPISTTNQLVIERCQ